MREKLVVSFMFFTSLLVAQTGVNITNPRAALDVSSTNAGLIPPAINIQNLTNPTTINPQGGTLVNGTIVYSTNTTNQGLFYWATNQWVKFQDGIKDMSTTQTVSANTSSHSITKLGPCGTLNPVKTDTNVESFDIGTIYRYFDISGLLGKVCNVSINIKLKHTWPQEIDMYLKSPDGRVLELCTDNGPSGRVTIFNFDVTFADTGASNITTWTFNGNISGTYKPEGSLTSDGETPNITTFAGFVGAEPNGRWTLVLRDDVGIDIFDYLSATLYISSNTEIPLDYKLVAQKNINSLTGKNVMAMSTYQAIAESKGLQTVLTRTTANQTATTVSTLPGSILSVSNVTTQENKWANLKNQALEESLTDNTNYYYQLWVKGAPTAPTTNNEQFSFNVSTINK